MLFSFPASAAADDEVEEPLTAADTAVFTCTRNNGDVFHSFKSEDGTHVLFLPADFNTSDLTVTCISDVKIKTASCGTMNPGSGTIRGNLKGRSVSVTFADGSVASLLAESSSLPSMAITLYDSTLDDVHEDKDAKHTVALTTVYDPKNADHDLAVSGGEFKGRGNSSWVYYDKKGYQLKLSEETSVLGMPAAKKWTLLAGASDSTLVRTKLALDAAASLPFLFTPKAEYADLWINGDYRGLYLITEKAEIGTDRLALTSGHGVLAEFDNAFYSGEDYWFEDDSEQFFSLKDAQGRTLHIERQRFGFRTIEYRHSYKNTGLQNVDNSRHVYGCEEDGLFVNGQKVIVKGVNPLSKAKNIEDVELIKSMNMNAVRLSHYPADPEFLDACDSLGLYVECELPGWHWAHETINGAQLVEEMVTRDVNHPSILFWSNGNEGGFNYDLEPFFGKFDPQKRVVLYPWANRNGFETKHYRSWGETAEYMRQKEIFMPTEFLHGLYDGGHGAGLRDYWQLMMSNPRCAGGFLWDLMDQGVVRTDQNNIVDCMGNFGADGIVGPHMEREGSFYTIKEVWSPVQIAVVDNKLELRNCYNFTDLKDCRFGYRWLSMPDCGGNKTVTNAQGTLKVPNIAPGKINWIDIPEGKGNALEITATDPHGRDINTWTFKAFTEIKNPRLEADKNMSYQETDEVLTVSSAGRTYTFSKKDGRLTGVKVGNRSISFGNGPRLVAAKRSDRSQDGFYNHDDKEAFQKKSQYTEYADQGQFDRFEWEDNVLRAHYRHGSIDRVQWVFFDDGKVSMLVSYNFNGVVDLLGVCFDYPEQLVRSKQWVGRGPYRVWQNRIEGPQFGFWQTDYNDPIPAESWEYPEFKGYFADVEWMQLNTSEGTISIIDPNDPDLSLDKFPFVGIYQPRDGRDHLLYELPETGIAVLRAIPAVRNKVNTTDLNGPSAQPYWSKGKGRLSAVLKFE